LERGPLGKKNHAPKPQQVSRNSRREKSPGCTPILAKSLAVFIPGNALELHTPGSQQRYARPSPNYRESQNIRPWSSTSCHKSFPTSFHCPHVPAQVLEVIHLQHAFVIYRGLALSEQASYF